jgi:hypothetical protein
MLTITSNCRIRRWQRNDQARDKELPVDVLRLLMKGRLDECNATGAKW